MRSPMVAENAAYTKFRKPSFLPMIIIELTLELPIVLLSIPKAR